MALKPVVDIVNFSPSEILKIIGEYSNTPEGKNEIVRKHKIKDKFVLAYEDKNKLTRVSAMKRTAKKMADILYKHVVADTVEKRVNAEGNSYTTFGLSEMNRSDIIVGAPYKVEGEGYHIDIGFEYGALHRDSLYPEIYGGIDNIVKLFVHGYSGAKNSVYGEWKHMYIHTRRSREGNDFLENAVDEINSIYGDRATATVKPAYKR